MISSILRRAGVVLRFLLPSAAQRRYVRQIRASGQFDRDFYSASNPRLRRLFQLAPERHYVLFGEAMGLCPNPGFSPRAYLYHNPDLGTAGVWPLQHYIGTGQAEQRTVLQATEQRPALSLPVLSAADVLADPAPVAVVLHLHYPDMWDEFAAVLAAQVFDFDLYVTLTGTVAETATLQARIRARFPDARIWALPNHGRDIFPFLYLLKAGLLAPYAAVCKLHSKKSPHRADGADWRQQLIHGILGDPRRTQIRLRSFLADQQAGIWVADGQHCRGGDWWGMNRPRTTELLARGGIAIADQPLAFPAGSIYWIKPPVLAQLAALGLDETAFEPEQALVDGTTAHALERAMGYLAGAAGVDIRETQTLDPPG